MTASLKNDARGLRHATLVGMPAVDEQGQPVRLDEDGRRSRPMIRRPRRFYPFVPWENVLINGQARQAGLQNILVPESRIEHRSAPVGGSLARLAYPTVVAEEKKVNSNAKPDEAWGWLPPPLVGEGRKVQTAWLHDFLLDPYPIRPAVVLRMPKFNMSPAEATKLANYFAAVDGVDYPYDFDPRTSASHLAAADATHPDRLSDALKIITDNNFCIKCHLLGDFNPTGSERAKAPRLDQVYKRLRPNFALSWIGNPKRILPYTGMPVNVPFDKPVSQSLYKGDSDQQLNAMVDLLLNYDRYTDSKTPIKPLIKPAPPQAALDAPSGLQPRAATPRAAIPPAAVHPRRRDPDETNETGRRSGGDGRRDPRSPGTGRERLWQARAPPPGAAARRLGTDVGKRHRNRPAGNAGRLPRLVPWRRIAAGRARSTEVIMSRDFQTLFCKSLRPFLATAALIVLSTVGAGR